MFIPAGGYPTMINRGQFEYSLVILLFIVITGCSGNPAEPSIAPQVTDTSINTQGINTHHSLGYWQLAVNTDTESVDVIPCRTGDLHFNITQFINDMSDNPYVEYIASESDPSEGLMVLEIYIFIPFMTNPDLKGFDTKGILMTPGSLEVGSLVFADTDETRLENADGYTRWWNPGEFPQPGLFGYTHGNMAPSPPSMLTANVNPYKYFCDLFVTDYPMEVLVYKPLDHPHSRGIFGYSPNRRRYRIRFPVSSGPEIVFGYAIDTSWAPPLISPPENGSLDFPINANQPEAYHVRMTTTDNTLQYDIDSGTGSGQLKLEVDVFDWQGQVQGNIQNEINSVRVSCPDLFIGEHEATFVLETEHYARYSIDLTGTAIPSEAGDALLVCAVESSDGSSYKQNINPAPDEPVTAYGVSIISVSDTGCSADENNSFGEHETILLDETLDSRVCFPDDWADFYKFTLPPVNAVTGNIILWCDTNGVKLELYDDGYSPLQEVDVSSGSAQIPIEPLALEPGRYFIRVSTLNGSETANYSLEIDTVITQPNPVPVNVTPAIALPGDIGSMGVDGDVLFAGEWLGVNLHSIDISTPSSAEVLDTLDVGFSIWEIAVGSDVVAAFEYGGIVQLVDTSDPSDLKIPETLSGTEITTGANIQGDYLYVVCDAGILVYDISTPSSSVLLSTNPSSYNMHDTRITEDYLVGMGNDVYIYSLADPIHPKYESTYIPPFLWTVDVEGDYLYVRWLSHLEIVDISTPSEPKFLSTLGSAKISFQTHIYVDGRFAYFCNDGSAWNQYPFIASIWPAENPEHVFLFDTDWYDMLSTSVMVNDNFLYFGAHDGIRIYDLNF